MPRYFSHQFGMLADRLRDRHEDHAGLLQFLLEGGRDRDRIEHGIDRDAALAFRAHHAFQHLDFAQGNAELLVSLEDIRIDLVERADGLLRLRRRVVIEILVIDLGVVDPGPFRLRHGQPAAISLQTPFQHPGRFVLFRRDEADGIFRQPLGGLVGLDKRLKSITILIDVDPANPINGLLYGRHSILRSRFQGPRCGSLQSITMFLRGNHLL